MNLLRIYLRRLSDLSLSSIHVASSTLRRPSPVDPIPASTPEYALPAHYTHGGVGVVRCPAFGNAARPRVVESDLGGFFELLLHIRVGG